MPGKSELIGAAVTLAVTVIGGLIVYGVTSATNADPKHELLAYSIDTPVSFEGNGTNVSIGSLRFGNQGDAPARAVLASIDASPVSIREIVANQSSGPAPKVVLTEDRKQARIEIPSLLPGDEILVTYLLDKKQKVDFDLRSQDSIGKPASLLEEDGKEQSILRTVGEKYLPILFLLSFVPVYLLRRQVRKLRRYSSCRNNTGFVLLHSGAVPEAANFLEDAVKRGEDGSIALANYAGALALTGDLESAQKYLQGARFLAVGNHERAIEKLNSAILDFCRDDRESATTALREAVTLSPNEIRSYAGRSTVLKRMKEWAPKMQELFVEGKRSAKLSGGGS